MHGQTASGGESPDSGHNTSSSPVESASSPACTARSCSEFEYSESSDLEGCERIERIRSKTAINTSRIPSMCVITPPASDNEDTKEQPPTTMSNGQVHKQKRGKSPSGSVLMSATVGTSKMQVINGEDKNLYATVQQVSAPTAAASNNNNNNNAKVSPLSGVLGKLRGVLPLPGRKQAAKTLQQQQQQLVVNPDSGDYVTIADVRNNNDKRQDSVNGTYSTPIRSAAAATYANADLLRREAEYVSLSDLPKRNDSSLERRRQGARVILDSEGKVVYSSDSLKRRKNAHTTFNPGGFSQIIINIFYFQLNKITIRFFFAQTGPFVKEEIAQSPSTVFRTPTSVRAVTKTCDVIDGPSSSPKLGSGGGGKMIIRAARSPERSTSPCYVRTPTTVVNPTTTTSSSSSPQKQQLLRGAYVNVLGEEGKTSSCVARAAANYSGTTNRLGTRRLLHAKARSEEPARLARNSPLPVRTRRNTLTPRNRFDKTRNYNCNNNSERKALAQKPPSMLINGNENSKSKFVCPNNLRPSGNTPRLNRRALLATELNNCCLDKENDLSVKKQLFAVEATTDDDGNSVVASEDSESKTERKIKRSESYRMANSPIMFIKKFSSSGDSATKSSRMFRSPSDELREDLMREKINYPETVSSPEPPELLEAQDACFEVPPMTLLLPSSPRPRALDLEPARVLKYSGNDTEIW